MTHRCRELIWVAIAASVAFPLWFALQFPDYLSQIGTSIPVEAGPNGTEVANSVVGGDHIQVFYLAWKLKHALLSGTSIFADPFQFAMRGHTFWDVDLSPEYWPIDLFGALFGHVGGYNLGFIILPPIVSFIGAYFLFGNFTRAHWLRIALAFALSVLPGRFQEEFLGHPIGAVQALLPWYWGAVLRRRMNAADRFGDALAAGSLVLLSLGETHLAYYTLLVSALVFFGWAIQDCVASRSLAPIRSLVVRWKYLLGGVIVVAAHNMVLKALLYSDEAGALRARSFDEIRGFSEPLSNFLGGWGNVGSLLFAALPLGALAVLVFAPQPGAALRRLYSSSVLPIGIAILLCLPLLVGIGDAPSQSSGLYEFCYRHLPFFAGQRVPGKLASTVALLIAVLSVVLFDRVAAARHDALTRSSRLGLGAAQTILVAMFLAQPLAYLSFLHRASPGIRVTNMKIGPHHIFDYLRTNLTQADIVLNIPVLPDEARYATWPEYMAYHTGARFASGYSIYYPTYFRKIAPVIGTFDLGLVNAENVALARQLGYTYLLNDEHPPSYISKTPERVANAFDQSPFLEKLLCDEGFCLYRIRTL